MPFQSGDSLHQACWDAVYEQLSQLDLPGLDASNCEQRLLPVDRDLELPGILVTPLGQETFPEGTFEDQDTGWPVTVFFLSASNQSLDPETARLPLLWRQRVIEWFQDEPLRAVSNAVAEAWDVQIEPGPVVDPQLWHDENLLGGWITLRVFTRKTRGREIPEE